MNEKSTPKYYDDQLNQRAVFLRDLVNSLVIQNLAIGNIPKFKSGIPMTTDNLMKLRKELEILENNLQEKEENKEMMKKKKK